jgi:hypothetical protein
MNSFAKSNQMHTEILEGIVLKCKTQHEKLLCFGEDIHCSVHCALFSIYVGVPKKKDLAVEKQELIC